MGRIINEKNVKIIVDGLELLQKYLKDIAPINIRASSNLVQSYTIEDVEKLLLDIKDNKNE